jgi:hypothetical protein
LVVTRSQLLSLIKDYAPKGPEVVLEMIEQDPKYLQHDAHIAREQPGQRVKRVKLSRIAYIYSVVVTYRLHYSRKSLEQSYQTAVTLASALIYI